MRVLSNATRSPCQGLRLFFGMVGIIYRFLPPIFPKCRKKGMLLQEKARIYIPFEVLNKKATQ